MRKVNFLGSHKCRKLAFQSKKIGIRSQGVNVLTRFSPKTSMISDAVLRSFSFRGSGPSANKESLHVSNYLLQRSKIGVVVSLHHFFEGFKHSKQFKREGLSNTICEDLALKKQRNFIYCDFHPALNVDCSAPRLQRQGT